MTVNSRYTDSESEINTKSASDSWKHIGELAKEAVKRSGLASK